MALLSALAVIVITLLSAVSVLLALTLRAERGRTRRALTAHDAQIGALQAQARAAWIPPLPAPDVAPLPALVVATARPTLASAEPGPASPRVAFPPPPRVPTVPRFPDMFADDPTDDGETRVQLRTGLRWPDPPPMRADSTPPPDSGEGGAA